MRHEVGKIRVRRQLFRPSGVIERINKHHVYRRQLMARDQPIQHAIDMVIIKIRFAVKQHQRPACRLRAVWAINRNFTTVAQTFAEQCFARKRTVTNRLRGSLRRAKAHGTQIEKGKLIPAIGILLAKRQRVKRISLRADQNRPPLIARRTVHQRNIRRQFVLHYRIRRHHIAAEPDVGIAQAEQRIVIACRRTENKNVLLRTAPQKRNPLMAVVNRLHQRRAVAL